MAAEMINTVLKAESVARMEEENAQIKADAILDSAKKRSADLYEAIVSAAQSEATLLITEAKELSDEIIKQAESIAKLRERKVISETEKKYPDMIKLILNNLV